MLRDILQYNEKKVIFTERYEKKFIKKEYGSFKFVPLLENKN
jgi:hypothetical protein